MTKEIYKESWEYSWVKSKSKQIEGSEWAGNFVLLLPAEFYPKGTLAWVADEKQLYRAKHKRRLTYVGRTRDIIPEEEK